MKSVHQIKSGLLIVREISDAIRAEEKKRHIFHKVVELKIMLKIMANEKSNNPFAEYMWMGEMEKFDEQLQEELLEEEFIKSCIEQLLEEEEERETVYYRQPNTQKDYYSNGYNSYPQGNQQVPNGYTNGVESLTQDMNSLYVNGNVHNNNKSTQNRHQHHTSSTGKSFHANTQIQSTPPIKVSIYIIPVFVFFFWMMYLMPCQGFFKD